MTKGITEHTESALAVVFGIAPQDMKTLRDFLTEGIHWVKKGRGVVYTEDGREQLRVALELAEGVMVPSEPQTLDLVVFRVCKNPRLIVALDAEKKERRVLVRNNAGCRRGMVLKGCKPVNAEEGLWKFTGHIRLPQ